MTLVLAVLAAGGTALAALALWIHHLESVAILRHSWRKELVEVRASAWKADDVEHLRQRVQRLELRQGLKP